MSCCRARSRGCGERSQSRKPRRPKPASRYKTILISETFNDYFTASAAFCCREAEMHRDPVTWSIEERIARCREQATFFESMAAAESRFVARDALMDLARQFNCLADALRESSQD